MDFAKIAVGLILLLVVVGGLLYIFYSRTNAVEKTGYGSLIMLSLISLMIPVFWIFENNNQADAKTQQYQVALARGMDLYASQCQFNCYEIVNGKLANVKYNGYAIDELNALNDDDLNRIIAGGIYNPKASPQPTNTSVIPRSDQYGGTLQSDYVTYLFDFIRSASPDYLKKNNLPAGNEFTKLVDYLQNNYPTQYQAAVTAGQAGQFGIATDMTQQSVVTIDIVTSSSCPPAPACFKTPNVKVKMGTEITWVNQDAVGHTVSAIQGTNTAAPKVAKDIFDSGLTSLIPSGGKFTYKVTAAAYNANPDHTLIYYCEVHPSMLAELTIVQ